MKTPPILFYLIAICTVGLFVLMNVWTVPIIRADAGGMHIFDNKPFGYGYDYAKDFLTLLSGPEKIGLDIYLGTQKYLDTFFPCLLATSLTWALWMLTHAWAMPFRIMLCAASIFGPLFDLLENAAVRVMLHAGPDHLTVEMVELASTFSRIKWYLDVIAVAAFVLLLWSLWHKRREAKRSAS